MQRATTATSATVSTTPTGGETACPVCGEPIRGIEAASPGEHRFVGCDHYASARFLRRRSSVHGPDAARFRLGP